MGGGFKGKNLLSIADLSPEDVKRLLSSAVEGKQQKTPAFLSGKAFALLFEKPSLRTRVSFEVAIHKLGGYAFYLSPEEVGLGKREPVSDVARVLSRYVDGIIARTFSHKTLETFAQYATVPVINALSDLEHPCQALTDLLTIFEKRGRIRGLTLAFIGDGNNVAHSLLLASSLVGLNVNIASPKGYEVNKKILQLGRGYAQRSGSRILLTNKPGEAVKNADIIYTDVWTSMGQEAETEKRRLAFAGYQVNKQLVLKAKKNVLLMHPMPAHQGEEIAAGLINSPASVIFDQAENRLHLQIALLKDIFGGSKNNKTRIVSHHSSKKKKF